MSPVLKTSTIRKGWTIQPRRAIPVPMPSWRTAWTSRPDRDPYRLRNVLDDFEDLGMSAAEAGVMQGYLREM